MNYEIRHGLLKEQGTGKVLAKIHHKPGRVQHNITDLNDQPLLYVNIQFYPDSFSKPGQVSDHRYIFNTFQDVIMVTHPEYNPEDHPVSNGWPVNRPPLTDRCRFELAGQNWTLIRQNGSHYQLLQADTPAVEFIHHELHNTWQIKDQSGLKPEYVLGCYVLCKYLEKENSFYPV